MELDSEVFKGCKVILQNQAVNYLGGDEPICSSHVYDILYISWLGFA